MLGAIIGDIVGSRFEWNNNKSKQFEFLTYKCKVTDDSIMSLAIAKAVLDSKFDYRNLSKNAVKYMQKIGKQYPNCGYGDRFREWVQSDNPKPCNSYGNGAAMRVSACGFVADSIDMAKELSKAVTEVTHNHPEGIKGAEATSVAIFLARSGINLFEIRDYIAKHYYPMDFTLDGIRDSYAFNESCQDTVPQALEAFFESTDFEDAIRNAISIGGDSDTLAAITGGIAEAYYGIPTDIRKHALTFLDEYLLEILVEFENKYPTRMEKVQTDKSVSFARSKDIQVETGSRADMMRSSVEAADRDLKDSAIESDETTSKQLFNHLFEACNILRGPINQDEFKSYVTPILFFKRISDVYDEETEYALKESGGDADYAAFPEQHSFIIPEGCHWADVRKTTTDVGKAIVLRPKDDRIARLLPFVLNTDAFWDYADQHSDGTMSKRLSPKTLMQYEFVLPNDDQQDYLADTLWAAAETKASYTCLLIRTDELVKSQFSEMFGDAIRDDKHWGHKPLCDVLADGSTVTYGIVQTNDDTPGGVPVFRPVDISQGHIPVRSELKRTKQEISDKYKRTLLRGDELLITVRGSIGETFQTTKEFEGCNVARNIVPLRANTKMIRQEFLKSVLDSQAFQRRLAELTKGVALKGINMNEFKICPIILPPLELQDEFEQLVRQADKSKFKLKQAIESVSSLIKALMQQDFSNSEKEVI